jgi:hypothetical protein
MKQLQLVLGLFIALVYSSAQTSDVRAKIPFDFRMGETLMPAGEYRIEHQSNGALILRQQGGRNAAYVCIPLPASRPDKPAAGSLQFNRYGENYFLTTVWSPNSQDGYALPKSTREKELASRAHSVETAGISLRK